MTHVEYHLTAMFSNSDDENPEGRKRPLMQSAQGQSAVVHSKRARAGKFI